jgi:hypothetical protein
MNRVVAIAIAAFLVALTIPANAQRKDTREQSNMRSVQGVVTDKTDNPLSGAVVQLKDSKTLQIRSFITQEDGKYHFNGLSTEIDYELKADHEGKASDSRTLSSFDSRKQAVMNLKIDK